MTNGRARPHRGEIWQVDFEPVVGHEQGGERPAVVVSAEPLNESLSEVAIVVPLSRRDRANPFHVPVGPPDSGLRHPSFVLCEGVRSVSFDRFRFRRGVLSDAAMALVADRLRILLDLG